ncbi:heat repeat-containing protein 5b [Phtheirospermum japonicum]|uniref:Heat repeat-containing protein 5b n=1 Tax=Phtheirospermum japonicum TaxID=374723 RepID=A0A830D0K0_9LAMI|nr:heat repeat-containing protein 5b [Phtheirospermum japonicum]
MPLCLVSCCRDQLLSRNSNTSRERAFYTTACCFCTASSYCAFSRANSPPNSPTLRHLALSTLRHLIEKDPVSIIDQQIEETLFHMLDEETDTEFNVLDDVAHMMSVGTGLAYYSNCQFSTCHYYEIALCIMPFASIPLAVDMPRHVASYLISYMVMYTELGFPAEILSTSSRHNPSRNNSMVNDSSTGPDGEKGSNIGDDDENMVSSSRSTPVRSYKLDYSSPNFSRDKHLRYRTRVFAAEPPHPESGKEKDWPIRKIKCLNHLPEAVGENPAHFDLSLARGQPAKGRLSGDWLVLQLQELISLAYQISTIQFEKMRPIGVSLLCTIMDKFASASDPELPDHLLLEQYQAQLVSAVRSALDSLSGPVLLETGLQLATKMLTSGIISRDQVAVKRIFSLISRPLDDFKDLYYPSYAEWVSCKIKVRLLSVHASLKCYMFAFLRRQGDEVPDEYLALLPLFAKSSSILGTYWLSFLKDYSFVRFHLHLGNWKPFLDGIQSSSVSVELQPCLEEAWPVILQALVLDAVPVNSCMNESSPTERSKHIPTSGYSMVELRLDDFQFLWGFSLLILFQEQDIIVGEHIIPVIKSKFSSDILVDDFNSLSSKLNNIFFPVFQFMSTERFFSAGYLTLDACRELMQVVQNCPKDFLEVENFAYLAMELCLTSLFKFLLSSNASSQHPSGWEKVTSITLITASMLLDRCEAQMQLKFLLPFLLIGYKCIGEASTEISLSRINDFVQSICSLLKRLGNLELGSDGLTQMVSTTRACLNATASLTNECVQAIHQLENKKSESRKMLLLKLAYSVELLFSYASLAFALEGPGENRESNPVLYRALHLSIQSIQSVLTDSNIQIQAIGLQVVKVMLQKGIGAESNSFLIFCVGELIEDLFVIVRNILEEANELRDLAVKLVSQLAQIPSSAASIKSILLSMPTTQRQQLQDIIRASVVQDKNPKPISSSGPPLVIKLPTQTGQNEENPSFPLDPPKEPSNDSSAEDEDEDDDDDWDTFQSFPASGNGTVPAPEKHSPVSYDSKNSDNETNSASPSLSNKEILSIEDHELGETHTTDAAPEDAYIGNQQTDEMVSGIAGEELLPDIQSDQVDYEEHTELLFPTDLKVTEMGPGYENDRPLSEVPHVDSIEIHYINSHDFEQGLSELAPTEISAVCVEPSRENNYHESANILNHVEITGNDEHEGPVVSTDNSELTSITDDLPDLGHHGDTPVQASLSETDDIKNDDKK